MRPDWKSSMASMGVSFNAPLDAGGLLVGEKVTLEFELSAVKTA